MPFPLFHHPRGPASFAIVAHGAWLLPVIAPRPARLHTIGANDRQLKCRFFRLGRGLPHQPPSSLRRVRSRATGAVRLHPLAQKRQPTRLPMTRTAWAPLELHVLARGFCLASTDAEATRRRSRVYSAGPLERESAWPRGSSPSMVLAVPRSVDRRPRPRTSGFETDPTVCSRWPDVRSGDADIRELFTRYESSRTLSKARPTLLPLPSPDLDIYPRGVVLERSVASTSSRAVPSDDDDQGGDRRGPSPSLNGSWGSRSLWTNQTYNQVERLQGASLAVPSLQRAGPC